MSAIKNVVLIGASGTLGPYIAKRVIDSGLFNVTIFKRPGSNSSYYTGTGTPTAKIVEVDLASQAALETALEGQDAVIATLAGAALGSQKLIIDAAAATSTVKRFIPSEFGADLENPAARQLPISQAKLEIQDQLTEKAKTSSLSYTLVFNSAFLEWGIQERFLVDLTTDRPPIFGDGNIEFSATSFLTVADAVVGILKHPEETKNRAVRVHDLHLTQNKVIELARKAIPSKTWEPVTYDRSLAEYMAMANGNLQKGVVNQETIRAFLHNIVFDPVYGSRFERTDNKLLGIKPRGEELIIETIKKMLK